MTKGAVTTILKELDETEYGEHVIIIHPDLQALRKIYCQYTKNQLVDNNEIVLLLPHYETPDAVKNNLQVKAVVVVRVIILLMILVA